MNSLYLYGVAPETDRVPAGLEDRLEIVSLGGLSALVESVGGRDFSPPVLEERLQSLDWVAGMASTHHAVLDRLMRDGPIVPARLCTMFSGPTALQAKLMEDGPRFHSMLSTIRGRLEWSIKVFCHRASLEQAVKSREGAAEPSESPDAPGRAFLWRKRRQAEIAVTVDAEIDDCMNEVIACVEELAFDTRSRLLLSERTTGRSDSMVLNLAALLDRGLEQFLGRRLDEAAALAGGGFSVELTGPWPAYSFCDGSQSLTEGDEGAHVEGR